MSVSIIVNCYQEQKKWFDIAIKSILAQEGVTVHLILSTVKGDPSIGWIKDYDGDIELVTTKVTHQKSPIGSYKQLNNAVKYIKHEFTCFCGADDYQMPDKCKNEISLLEKTGKHICYSAFNEVNTNLKIIEKRTFPQYDINKHLKDSFVYTFAMVRSSIFKKYMPFSYKWLYGNYWDLWLRIYEGEGNVFVYNPKPTMLYVNNDVSVHTIMKRNKGVQLEARKNKEEMLKYHKKILIDNYKEDE